VLLNSTSNQSFLCVGDTDIMFHSSNQLVIPAGYPLPSQYPGEFKSCVDLFKVVSSEFADYVYLVTSYLLTECVDVGKYNISRQRFRFGCVLPVHSISCIE